jgi:hypothetical protein
MFRIIFAFLLNGVLSGAGVVLFYWIGYSRLVWKWPFALVGAVMLVSFIRLIPALGFLSTLDQALKDADPDRQKVISELGLRKPALIPVGTLCLVCVLCVLGVIVRYSR